MDEIAQLKRLAGVNSYKGLTPYDINEGSKLELGSTAKIRVLTTYLEIIAELHETYAELESSSLRKIQVSKQDVLSRWAINYLATAKDRSLPLMLDAALNRTYSASPYERFFTGGGLHTFNNFSNTVYINYSFFVKLFFSFTTRSSLIIFLHSLTSLEF